MGTFKRAVSDRAGFTLIELMIVVVILGILSAIALPNFINLQRRAKVGHIASEMRSFSVAFVAYQTEYGQYPPDTHGALPAAMDTYIKPTVWSEPTPLGGNYNWEGPDFYTYAGISIDPPNAIPVRDLLILDSMLDDGNLAIGKFRLGAGGRPTYIIEDGI